MDGGSQGAAHNWQSVARGEGGLGQPGCPRLTSHQRPLLSGRVSAGLPVSCPRATLSSDAVALGWLHGESAVWGEKKRSADGTRFGGQCVFVFGLPSQRRGGSGEKKVLKSELLVLLWCLIANLVPELRKYTSPAGQEPESGGQLFFSISQPRMGLDFRPKAVDGFVFVFPLTLRDYNQPGQRDILWLVSACGFGHYSPLSVTIVFPRVNHFEL
ncbi:UNVERIFIED_CONTAM: hypothetical protein FKN15_032185 [Acipenser sinensis]